MGRQIKFRVWNKGGNNMLYDIDNVFECLKQQIKFDNSMPDRGFITGYDHRSDGMEWMQFTGLKDKNGNTYCADDIVRYEGRKYRLIQGNYSFELVGFWEASQDNPSDFFSENAFLESEIIGNIHEHPELIK